MDYAMEYVNATCKFVTLAMSKEKGTPSVKLRFETGENEILYHDLWLTDSCFDRTMDVLRGVFGWFGDDVREFLDNHTALSNVEVELAVGKEEYNGKEYWRVKFVNPVGGRPDAVTQMDANTAREIGEKLRGRIALYDQKKKQEQQAAAQGGAAPAKPGTPKPAAAVPPKPAATPDLTPVSPRFTPAQMMAVPPPSDSDLPF
jgi:hypothetical protein